MHPSRIERWREVRRAAACFARITVEEFDAAGLFSQGTGGCRRMRAAIDRTLDGSERRRAGHR